MNNEKKGSNPRLGILSRYELARVIGLRALQLSEGQKADVFLKNDMLDCDFIYIAALEIYEKKLDACVLRKGNLVPVCGLQPPSDLVTLLNSRDGGSRRVHTFTMENDV